jgi:group II intron reverse transcriptase/maturase
MDFVQNRSAKHALARAASLININGLHYVVDIDIKSFFDTIDHGKLLKQCWSLGIRDKKVLSILSKMLKAEIVKEGIPDKGTPQGGILSPLLPLSGSMNRSNICLNELDWWLSSQWASFRPTKSFSSPSKTWRALRQRSRLKEFHAVRYADDFKIFCRDYKTAKKIFIGTQQWLETRLKLQISTEKSSITNLRKKGSPFLGILLRSRINKKHRLVCRSRVMPKAMQNMLLNLKSRVTAIQKNPTANNVSKFNTTVMGLQNYYNAATDCSVDFGRLNYILKKFMRPRLKSLISYRGLTSKTFRKRYSIKSKPLFISGVALFPVYSIKHKNLYQFTQELTPYTKVGRQLMHKELNSLLKRELERWHLTFGALDTETALRKKYIDYFDNRISNWSAQKGLCGVTGIYVGLNFHCHHKIPVSKGGTDSFNNLVIVASEVHNLIHATAPWTISETLKQTKLLGDFSPKKWNEILRKLNIYREQVGLNSISG